MQRCRLRKRRTAHHLYVVDGQRTLPRRAGAGCNPRGGGGGGSCLTPACRQPAALCWAWTKNCGAGLRSVAGMGYSQAEHQDPLTRLAPPVRLAVKCPACGHARATLALHADALRRASRCERCGAETELAE